MFNRLEMLVRVWFVFWFVSVFHLIAFNGASTSFKADSKAKLGAIVSVSYENSKFTLHDGLVSNWVSRANFTDNIATDGWTYLEVETNRNYPSHVQAYAAGYAEGAASNAFIYNSYRNNVQGFCAWKGQKICNKLFKFISENFHWMNSMLDERKNSSALWYQVSLVLNQLEGLQKGYNETSQNPIEEYAILAMNLLGDLEDLENVFNDSYLNISEWVSSFYHLTGDGHCSALVKVLPGNMDLFVSHVTWNTYQSMLRVQKKYIFPFTTMQNNRRVIAGHTVSFSSYPGVLHSIDDFYILSSGLTVLETTISNTNPRLWANVTADGELLEWIRVLTANRLSRKGQEWTDIFSIHNSGTYNNQWMVVDYNLFKSGKKIKPNTLWVLEQLPGLIIASDQSNLLKKQTYWPSYNVAFYPSIFNLSGAPALVDKYGDWYSYYKSPRALIFKRDHKKVRDIDSMMRLMRYNDYTNDPLSRCNCTPPYSAENAISARCDLNPKNGSFPFAALGHRSHGATDVKVTSSFLANKLLFLAVNGPTYDQQPVFQWSVQDFKDDTPHYGHPDVFNFPVVLHHWIW